MKRLLTARIARCYLFSKKSHSAVSAITAVSVVGVAVATAAIVCVLSVFNGFRNVLADKLNLLAADITVMPAKGKLISSPDSLIDILRKRSDTEIVMPVVSDNALGVYNSREMPVRVKGVESSLFRKMTAIDSIIIPEGKFTADSQMVTGPEDEYGERMEQREASGTVSVGVATRLSIYDLDSKLLLFTPRNGVRVNPANPMASFICDSLSVSGVYQARQSDYDDDYVITDLATARDLFELDDEATSIEIKIKPDYNPTTVASRIRDTLGPEYMVKDRLRMQEMNFRMIEIEKWVTFLLLFFILLIAGFNLVSTLSMLILEKSSTLRTLRSLGMTRRSIGSIFVWESLYVTLMGGVTGMILGIILSLAQEHYGFIKLNGDADSLVINAYPVALQWSDLLIVCIPLAVVGTITAAISYRYAIRKAAR